MIRDAIEKILEMAPVEYKEINGKLFSSKQLVEIDGHKIYTRNLFKTNTLESIVDFIKLNPDKLSDVNPFIIQVENHKEVNLYHIANEKMQREQLLQATAIVPNFNFGTWYPRETFNIALQSQFVREQNATVLLQVIGNMQADQGVNVKDDGITQEVVAKTGVVSVSQVQIPNPLSLKPYRTFIEIDQPESPFVFRIGEKMQLSLNEADGGFWRNQAIKNIKNYFHEKLKEEIESGIVSIIG